MAIQPDIQPNTSAFPQDLPPRDQSWKQRNCPNMRACWHVSFSSYNPRDCPDKHTLWRRIAMIFILFVRTAMSVLTVIGAVKSMNIAAIVIYAVLAVLGYVLPILAIVLQSLNTVAAATYPTRSANLLVYFLRTATKLPPPTRNHLTSSCPS